MPQPNALKSLNTSSSEWATTRGERWRSQLAGVEAMTAPVDEPLIHALHLDAPYRIADLGCGGGGSTLQVLRRAPAGSIVHGFDISPALIEVARTRIPSEGSPIAFDVADMATAPAPDQPYDRVLARFSTMFFDDPPAAFGNLLHWLAPGGRFAFAVWGPVEENLWTTNVRDAAAQVIELPAANPEGPGPFRYAAADKLLGLLAKAGFTQLEVKDWRGTLPIGGTVSVAEAADFALAGFSKYGELLAEAGKEALNAARQSLITRFSRYERDGAVRLEACVHIVTGAKPG